MVPGSELFKMGSLMDHFLNATIRSPDGQYNVSLVAQFFHAIPHLDIKLSRVNSTFDPNDNEYLEALGILVAIPGFWLILTLLFFLIFFLCRCCDVNSKKTKKLTCCKCCLFLFTLITSTVIGVGFYGNYQSHEGMMKVQNSTSQLEVENLETLRNLTDKIESTFEVEIDGTLEKLSRKLVGPLVRNYTVLSKLTESVLNMKRNVTQALTKIEDIKVKVRGLDLGQVPRTIKEIEQYRWPITLGIGAFLLFICLILFCGVCRHSRCLLILFSVLGLLSLVICWVMTSLYLGECVAGSDFCMNPKPFLNKQFSASENIIINYYLNCDVESKNPFLKPLKEIEYIPTTLNEELQIVSRICEEFCPGSDVTEVLRDLRHQINVAARSLSAMRNLTDCANIHQEYLNTMNFTCKDVLEGVAIMLAASSVSGLLLTLLVLCASHTWINIRKKRTPMGEPNEETDPFLPPTSASSTVSSANSKRMRESYGPSSSSRPRFSHTPPQTPHFPSSGPISTSTPTPINGRSVDRDQLSFLTPPPSYEQVGQHPVHHQPQLQHQPHPHHGHHQQAVGPHYVADTDLMMRATQATKF